MGPYNIDFLLAVLLASILCLTTACQRIENITAAPTNIDALSQAKDTICDKQIVLLGEGPNHGEGTTEIFKSKLTKSLVSDCGFELILFEASFYEFIRLNERVTQGVQLNQDDIGTAIGGLWRYDTQMQSLIAFMVDAVNTGKLALGGIDDQLGGRGQDFTNYALPGVLMSHLDVEIRESCQKLLEQRSIYSFPKEQPYNWAKKNELLSCLENDNEKVTSPDVTAMRKSVERFIDRDFEDNKNQFQGREDSMYGNFEMLYAAWNTPPKTIIWSSTVHVTKSRKALQFIEGPTLGERIKTTFENDSYVIGFSALTGSHRLMGGKDAKLPEAPPNSIEKISLKGKAVEDVFLDTKELAAFGLAPAAAIKNSYQEENWNELLDGLVIFREQTPVTRVNRPVSNPL